MNSPSEDSTSPGTSLLASHKLVMFMGIAFLALALGRCWANLPWCDEGWFFDPAYNWLTKGYSGTTVMEGAGFPWAGIERYQFWQPPLQLIVDAAWLKIFGLTLFAFRALSTAAGIVWLLCWYYLLRYFEFPRAVMLLSMLFLTTDYAIVRAASDGRMDMLAATFGIAGVVAYLRFREHRFSVALFLSQTLIVCGGLTHPMGGLVYLGFVIYFFVRNSDWKRVKAFHLALAAIPYMVGAAGWGAYIMRDPQLFRKIFFGANVSGRMNGFLNPVQAFHDEVIKRYLAPFGLYAHSWVVKSKLAIPVVYLCAAATVCLTRLWRSQTYLRPIFGMWTICFLCFVFFDAQRNGAYMIHIFPEYAILLAAVTCRLWWKAALARPLLVAFVVGFVSLQVGGSAYLIATNPYSREYRPVVDFVRQHSKPGDRIVGSAEFGFGLGFDNVHDDEALGYFVNRKPDVIIVDRRYQDWYDMQSAKNPAIHQFIRHRLDREFRQVYHNDTYRVYLPRLPASVLS